VAAAASPRPVVVDGRTQILTAEGLLPAHCYVSPDPDPQRVRRFRAQGVRGVSFSATADFHPYSLARPAWAPDGRYDFSEFDERCRRTLAAAPDAWLLPRVHVCSPPWWDAAHPAELAGFEDGGKFLASEEGYLKRGAASFSSHEWREQAAASLGALVAHAAAAEYASAVAGIVVCGGRTEEWFQLGSIQDVLTDGGPPFREAFRSALAAAPAERRERVLRAAGVVRIEDAFPSYARRRAVVGPSRFLDPIAHADVLFCEEIFAAETADAIAALCRVVDRASAGRFAAGAFYGYLVEMASHGAAMRHGGHLALRRLLDEPTLSFLASPTSYQRRDPETGASFSMLPTETVLAAGKALFHENDVRTCLLWETAGYGRAATLPETRRQLRREASYAVDHGLGLWWFDMTGGFYDHPELEAEAGAGVARALAAAERSRPRPDLAFVVDEDSLRTADLWGDWYADYLPRQLAELMRLGEPVGIYLLDDFLSRAAAGPPFAFVLWPNLFRVEPETIARLREFTAAGRALLQLFLGPCGTAPTERGAPPGPAATTGLPITVESGSFSLRLRPDPAFVPDGPEFGRGHWWPTRSVPEVDAAPRGRAPARDLAGRPAGLLACDEHGARAFVAGPILDVAFLRALRAAAHPARG
jgi:hypothetical protein